MSPLGNKAFFRVAALRNGTEIGHCVVESESFGRAEAIGRFQLAQALQLKYFDVGIRYAVIADEGPPTQPIS